jgi:hypothetical protein
VLFSPYRTSLLQDDDGGLVAFECSLSHRFLNRHLPLTALFSSGTRQPSLRLPASLIWDWIGSLLSNIS